jgi:hypothetical protein
MLLDFYSEIELQQFKVTYLEFCLHLVLEALNRALGRICDDQIIHIYSNEQDCLVVMRR